MRAKTVTRYTAVAGQQIAFQIVGDGDRDLLWFWGLSNLDLQWGSPPLASALERLSRYGRLLLFDRRGTGISDGVSSGHLPTWEDWAEDVTAVLDAAGSTQAAICAVGDGGPLGILFAALHPERVSALVLQNTTARNLVAEDYPIGRSVGSVERMLDVLAHLWGTEDWGRGTSPGGAGEAEHLRWAAMFTRGSATPRSALAQYRYLLMDMDVRSALPLVQAPTLVRHHPAAIYPMSHGRFISERIPNAEFQEFSQHSGVDSLGDVEAVLEWLTGERPVVDVDRILTTVLFTDIVASTEHLVARGDRQWRALLDGHDRMVREQLHRFRGREINTTGDGFAACFDGPGRAVACASAITREAQKLGIEVRAGIHTGECEVRENDLSGLAMHVAKRIESLADPGHVWVSSTVKDLVAGSGIEFADKGDHHLKGIPTTWKLFAMEDPA